MSDSAPIPVLCAYEDAISLDIHHGDTDWQKNEWNPYQRLRANSGELCIMCQHRLKFFQFTAPPPFMGLDPSQVDETISLWFCEKCGYWFSEHEWYEPFGYSQRATYKSGIVKEYNISDNKTPLDLLRRYFKDHPDQINLVDPLQFEKLMADCLKAEYQPCAVIHVGRTGDMGIDIMIIQDDDDVILVQVKRRENIDKSESVSVVRELNGVLFRDNRSKGMIITTARRFTEQAKRELDVKTPIKNTYAVSLRPFDDVRKLLAISPSIPYEPWVRHIPECLQESDAYKSALKVASHAKPWPRILSSDLPPYHELSWPLSDKFLAQLNEWAGEPQ